MKYEVLVCSGSPRYKNVHEEHECSELDLERTLYVVEQCLRCGLPEDGWLEVRRIK